MMQPGMQGLGLIKIYDGSLGDASPDIDVVAVHGIAADPKRTWTKNGVAWLTDDDMLPSAIPQARIFRFGYESEWLGSKAIQVKISTIANQLLQALKSLRSQAPSPPILFVGHCFGGIIIEKTLLLSDKTSNSGASLIDKVAGIITLGTPHGGSASQPVASIIARIASLVRLGEDSRLVQSTSRDSDILSDIVNEFALMARRYNIPMHCFFEQHKSDIAKVVRPLWMSWWKRMELVVDEQSACLQGVARQALPSDHFHLNRFAGPEDPSYVAVRGEIIRMYKERVMEVQRNGELTAEGQMEADEALNAIFLTDPEDDFWRITTVAHDRLPNTANWIQDSAMYQSWRSSNSSMVLWISGSPGKGKTTIAMALIDKFRYEQRTTKNLWTSFFLCDRDDYRRSSATAIVRGILYHILRKHPQARRFLRSEYDKQKQSLISSPNSIHSLWRVLQQIISFLAYKEVVIILDGLDECDDSSIETLLSLIQSGYTTSQTNPEVSLSQAPHACSVKWLIVSRRDDAIHERLNGCTQIDLEANQSHVTSAVEEFVEMQVSSLANKKRYGAALQTTVKQALLRKAEGTFLWVSLACVQLAKPGVKAMHVERIISSLPHGLTPLYQKILEDIMTRVEGINEEDKEYVACILRSMSVALRPLNIFELGVVADLPDDYREDRSALEDFVRLCGGLVELRQNTVHFVHSSVNAFLSTTRGIMSPDQNEDHLWAASNCLYSLWVTFGEVSSKRKGMEERDTPPFLDYPAVFWNRHARRADTNFLLQLHRGNAWWAETSNLRDVWFAYHWKATHSIWNNPARGMTALLVAAYACVPAMAQVIIEKRGLQVVAESDEDGNTGLIWSARGNDSETATLLLTRGADVNIPNKKGESPLHFAAFNGDCRMGDILVTAGAKLDAQDDTGWTALHRAAFGGHTTMLGNLLLAGAEVDTRDKYSWTALQRSASTGNVQVLAVLANHGAKIEVKDREGMTPLSTAAWNGHVAAADELVKRGVKIEARDYEGWSALHHACWNARSESAQLLIDRGANINALNNEQASPLFQATWNGNTDIVEMLLARGADINMACDGGETPLQQAAWAGHAEVVDILIKAGAQVNLANDEGLTALHQASVNGQDEVVELLLETGADPSLQNSDGQTAYDQAEENSYATTALVLLEKGSPHPSVSSSYSDYELGVLDSAIAKVLSVDTMHTIVQRHGHACSSRSWKVTVDSGKEQKSYFLKTGPNINMFAGEHRSLTALDDAVPFLCPRSIAYGMMADSEDAFLLTDFIQVGNHKIRQKPQTSLAQKLAKLHNAPIHCDETKVPNKFGFPTDTFAGPVLQSNSWKESWEDFFANQRLRGVCKVIAEKYKDEMKLFEAVERIIDEVVPRLLATGHLGGSDGITPSLVHGDLWSGNKTCGVINENDGVQHYVFDASSCYAHSEYELGLMRMFGGFSAGFFSEYHRLVPKTEPMDEYEDRMLLYQLYHWLVNYAITGGGFKDEATSCMEKLLQTYGRPLSGT